MLKPEFKITFGDVFSPIYVETELFFYKHTELEKVALAMRKIMEDTLFAQKKFFVQEITSLLREYVVERFLSNKEYLIQAMLNDPMFFREYSGRKFTFKTNQAYLEAIERELTEDNVIINLARIIDQNSIKIKDFEKMDTDLTDFIEESVRTLSETDITKESTDYEFKIYYDLDNFLSHNGRMTSAFPDYLKNCGVVKLFHETVKDLSFSIVIFVLRNEHSFIIK